MMIGEHTKNLIQENWQQIKPKSLQLVEKFYYDLFRKYPAFQDLFTSNSYRQNVKFSDMLNLLINSLDETEELSAILRNSGQRHEGYGVKTAYYRPVGQALIGAIQEASGSSWNPELESAWNQLLEWVVSEMTTKEQ